MTSKAEYIPGVCNIGPAEIRRRRQSGWIGGGITIGASGFLQAALHFCAGFGTRGVFNFGSVVGATQAVERLEFRRKDQRKARVIGLYAAMVGIGIAAAGFFLPL